MPYCPKCKAEYREGFTVCADCGEALVDEIKQPMKKAGFINKLLMETDDKDSLAEEAELSDEFGYSEKNSDFAVKPQPELGDEVPLITVDSQVKLVYITSILEAENIPYRVMERGVGQYISIYMGTSFMGKTIYVDEKNLEPALKIASSYEGNVVSDEE